MPTFVQVCLLLLCMALLLLALIPLLLILLLILLGSDFRRRMFARFYDRMTRHHEAWLSPRKQSLLGEIRGRVLEIGPGTGVNLGYLDKDIDWIGLEPNPHMHVLLREKARRAGLRCDIRAVDATGIDMGDDQVDWVVSTLVLCSVPDPVTTLREIRRVLKPGGSFVFLEHVAAPAGSKARRWQSRIKPLWSLLADGCCPDRELDRIIREAGFSKVELEEFQAPKSIAPSIVAPHIIGRAHN